MVNNSNKIFATTGGENKEFMTNKILSNKTSKLLTQKGFRKFYSNKRYQFKFSECGMYSIFFIHSMLLGKTYRQTLQSMKYDDEINNLPTILLQVSCLT